jgi:hypothetical protein
MNLLPQPMSVLAESSNTEGGSHAEMLKLFACFESQGRRSLKLSLPNTESQNYDHKAPLVRVLPPPVRFVRQNRGLVSAPKGPAPPKEPPAAVHGPGAVTSKEHGLEIREVYASEDAAFDALNFDDLLDLLMNNNAKL